MLELEAGLHTGHSSSAGQKSRGMSVAVPAAATMWAYRFLAPADAKKFSQCEIGYIPRRTPDRLLLYIDQWEELYAQAPSPIAGEQGAARHATDINRFIDLLLNASLGPGYANGLMPTGRSCAHAPQSCSPRQHGTNMDNVRICCCPPASS
jgi:hypothetical protein